MKYISNCININLLSLNILIFVIFLKCIIIIIIILILTNNKLLSSSLVWKNAYLRDWVDDEYPQVPNGEWRQAYHKRQTIENVDLFAHNGGVATCLRVRTFSAGKKFAAVATDKRQALHSPDVVVTATFGSINPKS